jgi:VWFA-related protein
VDADAAMTRGTPFILTLLLAAAVRAGPAEQEAPQRFRAGVDLITVDVAAVDAKGRPVEDLRPRDFTVTVGGKQRSVVSADLLTVDRARGSVPQRPVDALIASNVTPINARHVVIAVDQTLVTPGQLTPLLRTASQFVDRLTPADYAAFIAFPEPGPRVDFTTDKATVRSAMQTISVGQPSKIPTSQFDISLYEAFMITGAESTQNADKDLPPGPVMELVLARAMDSGACELVPPPMTCKQAIYNESRVIAAEARLDGNISLRALESLLTDLVPLTGSKTMVIFSAGMVAEDPTRLDELVRRAAAARTTINVIAVERDRGALISERNIYSRSALADRSFELQGLEGIADRTNGRLFRGVAAGTGIFEQLESALSAWYVVAVERQSGETGPLKLEVDVRRRGVTLRSNRTVMTAAAAPTRSIDDLLSDALSSPFTLPGLPLRISTFMQRDAEPGTYRVRVAADIGQPGEPAGDLAIGYVLTDPKGRVVTSAGSRRRLSPDASGAGQVLHYDMALNVSPGAYTLRVAAVHQDGRRGAVVHRIELPTQSAEAIATSDLIVGNLPAEGETLSPRVEPQVTASELAGYLELYLPDARGDNVAVTLAIAEGEASPALATAALTLRPGDSPSSFVATGFVPATMTAGRYVARATVSREGAVVKTLSRPFVVVRDPTVVSRPDTRTRGIPITPQLQQLTARYVASVVNGLATPAAVVAEENFTLSKPDRRVTADLLLVGYPGAPRDLIPYRDVWQVDGRPIAGREQRLVDLFVNPTDSLRNQVRKIWLDADAYVPSAFNPMFVVAFLQAEFQGRFQFTVSDAGKDWSPQVKAVMFVEVGRPTLLRQGTFGDIDVPTRGTAWIEETTGRILQTELEVGRGRSAPTMVTTFGLDDRLQITVPVEMRTRNPEGIATYTNFRRHGVATDADVLLPRPSNPPQR